MKSVLEKIDDLDTLIHCMAKMENMMRSGKWIDAHRECCRLAAGLKRAKQDVIAEAVNGEATPADEE